MKTVVLLYLCIGMNYAMKLRKPKMPFELRRVMANVTSLDSFVRAMSIETTFMTSLKEVVRRLNSGEKSEDICLAVSRPKECPLEEKDLCVNDSTCSPGFKCCNTGCRKECSGYVDSIAGRAGLSNPDFPDLPSVFLDSASCEARPVPVEVPQPADQNAFHFPFVVLLHRCGGACNDRPFETKCQAQESQDLNLVVTKVAWSSASDKLSEISREFSSVPVTNHTKCGCLCASTPADCNNRTERFSKETCRCECKTKGVLCPFNFLWNPEKCQCTCNPKAQQRCNKRYQFDEKLCRCTCSTRPCKMAIKVRDPRNCRCKCPRRKCSPGMRYDLHTCTCRRIDNRRGRKRLM